MNREFAAFGRIKFIMLAMHLAVIAAAVLGGSFDRFDPAWRRPLAAVLAIGAMLTAHVTNVRACLRRLSFGQFVRTL